MLDELMGQVIGGALGGGVPRDQNIAQAQRAAYLNANRQSIEAEQLANWNALQCALAQQTRLGAPQRYVREYTPPLPRWQRLISWASQRL